MPRTARDQSAKVPHDYLKEERIKKLFQWVKGL